MIKPVAFLTSLFLAGTVAGAGAATPPALYTPSQAAAGAAVYTQSCAMCHGTALQGQVGPALTGQSFAPSAKHDTVGGVFSLITEQMPLGQPGSLSHTQYENVMAYILSKNGYPAGGAALAYQASLTSSVPLVSQAK
jgi:mono/diheme cytochrome c family protein